MEEGERGDIIPLTLVCQNLIELTTTGRVEHEPHRETLISLGRLLRRPAVSSTSDGILRSGSLNADIPNSQG